MSCQIAVDRRGTFQDVPRQLWLYSEYLKIARSEEPESHPGEVEDVGVLITRIDYYTVYACVEITHQTHKSIQLCP